MKYKRIRSLWLHSKYFRNFANKEQLNDNDMASATLNSKPVQMIVTLEDKALIADIYDDRVSVLIIQAEEHYNDK